MLDRLRSMLGYDTESGEAAETANTQQASEAAETQGEVTWMMRITDKEYKIDDRNEFQYSIETGISDIVSSKEKYIVLRPSAPVYDTVYLKLSHAGDALPGTFTIEAGKLPMI